MVVIRHRKEHKAIETGYYEAKDTEKQHRNLYFPPPPPSKLIFEALKTAQQRWKIQRAQNKAKIHRDGLHGYVQVFSLFEVSRPLRGLQRCRVK